MKFFLKSKTIIGIIIGVLPTVLPVFGITLSADDSALFTGAVDAVITAIGAVLAVYGRIKADGDISLTP